MTSSLHRITLGLAIVSQLALGIGRGPVLCVEADGDVQLEIGSSSCCEPRPAHALHAAQGEPEQNCSGEDPGCGGCTDQQLKLVEVPNTKVGLPPWFAVPHVRTACWRPADRTRPARLARAPDEPRLARLSSVVLRC